MLAAMPEQLEKYTESEQRLIKALTDGPLIYEDAAKAVGISPYILKVGRLEDEGVVLRCGVTPTDVMHITGDYVQYDVREMCIRDSSCFMPSKPSFCCNLKSNISDRRHLSCHSSRHLSGKVPHFARFSAKRQEASF